MQEPRLSAFDIGCVVIGGIIGVGIFFTPARVAAAVDNETQVIAAWSLGGLIAVLGALVFARLARNFPEHGGTFVWIARQLGPLPAFLYGWANWLVIQAGALGVIGIVFAENLDVALHGSKGMTDAMKVTLAVVAILLFTAINAVGLRAGSRVQNALTITKVLAILGLVLLAVFTGGHDAVAASAVSDAPVNLLEPMAPAVSHAPKGWFAAMAAAILPVMFACGGWQQGAFVAGAARNPARDVPLGILGGVAVVVVAYLTVNLAFLHLLGFAGAAQSTTIGADAARAGLEPLGYGNAAARVLAAMIAISALGIVNTICLAPPYVLHAMSKQGLFPRAIGALDARTGTPVFAVLVQGGQGIVLLLGLYLVYGGQATDVLGFLLDGVVFVDWIFYALAGVAALLLADRRGNVVASLFTGAAVLVCIGAIASNVMASASGLAVLLIGAAVYGWSQRRRA